MTTAPQAGSDYPTIPLPEIVADYTKDPEGFEQRVNDGDYGVKIQALLEFNGTVRGAYDPGTEQAIKDVTGIVESLTEPEE